MATKKLTAEELEAWCAGLPAHVAEVVRKYPPDRCYRSTQNPRFHYVIYSYEENAPSTVVTLKLVHGADSTLPGIATFGQPVDQLLPCDCGKWKQPSEEQVARLSANIRAEGDRMRARKKKQN